MKYYIIKNISKDYNMISNEAKDCEMEVKYYLKYSIETGFNVNVQNIRIEDNKIIYDVTSNNYNYIKDFVYQCYGDENHYDLIKNI